MSRHSSADQLRMGEPIMSFNRWLQNLRSTLSLDRGKRRHRRRDPAQAATRPNLEVLEDRTVPSTFSVLNLADSGEGSLRQAVLDANANTGADVIRFDGRLQGTITLASELSITDDLAING